jgi:hypothetical protein
MTKALVVSEHGFTDWFPSNVEPVRAGVYQVRSYYPYTNPFLAKWDGYFWRDAVQNHCIGKREWRGLTYSEYKDMSAKVQTMLISELKVEELNQ